MRLDRTCMTAVVAVGVVLAAGCGDGTDPPQPGLATVSLTTPNSDDGAVLVRVTGQGLSSAQASSSSYLVYWRLVSETELHVAVFGSVSAGPMFTVQVSDVRQLSAYTGTVEQVADRNDALRSSLSGYGVTVSSAAEQ